MPEYSIKCKSCDYNENIIISIKDYDSFINSNCPKCNEQKLYQDMSKLKIPIHYSGSGWTRNGHGFGQKYKKGSQKELDSLLRENDYLNDKLNKVEVDPKDKIQKNLTIKNI